MKRPPHTPPVIEPTPAASVAKAFADLSLTVARAVGSLIRLSEEAENTRRADHRAVIERLEALEARVTAALRMLDEPKEGLKRGEHFSNEHLRARIWATLPDGNGHRFISVKDACIAGGWSRVKLYTLIREHKIAAYKDGNRTIIDLNDIATYRKSLPKIEPKGMTDARRP